MKLFALYTGGKDSTLAILKAMEKDHNIDALVVITADNPYSYMFHTPNVRWTYLHAISMGIKHYLFKSSGIKDIEIQELEEIFKLLKSMGYDGFVSGAVASRYQRNILNKIGNKLGLDSITPLWGRPQEDLLMECIKYGIEFMIVRVAAWGLDKRMLGKIVRSEKDAENLINLSKKYGFNPTGEGGEYETFVLKAPNMKRRIQIYDYDVVDEGDSATLVIKRAELL